MSNTRILDATLAVLKGTPGSKRAKLTCVNVDLYVGVGKYTIQVGGRVVEDQAGTEEQGKDAAFKRAEKLRALGKNAVVNIY